MTYRYLHFPAIDSSKKSTDTGKLDDNGF
jgi:hypothetical protein